MNSGVYAACSGLVARMEALNTIASNMANSSSTGYQGSKDAFSAVLSHAGHASLSSLNKVTNSFSLLAGSRLDTSQGTISKTNNSLDAAIQGPGYFKVETAKGLAYTRNGSFQVDSTGRLVTMTGDVVLGEAGPIVVGNGPVTMSPDGTVTSSGAVCGKLTLVDFAPGTELAHRGGGYYNAPPGARELIASAATIQQGAIEGSNVDPINCMVQLISAQRAAESMRHAVTLLDTEMNKTAVQELARIS